MNAKEHQAVLSEFIQKGGNKRITESCKRFSLQNFAKIKYELKRLVNSVEQEAGSGRQEANSQESTTKSQPPRAKVFNDLISDYPSELHLVYQKRWDLWLKACSFKVKLNEFSEFDDDEKAFVLQLKIHYLFQQIDECQKILSHFREHKRIMPTTAKTDYSRMTEVELYKIRNNLRGLITRRKQTIEKMECELPHPDDAHYRIKLHSLNLKREQLQEKINELLEIEKLLK